MNRVSVMLLVIFVVVFSCVASPTYAIIVFADDFDDADGTALDGKASDIGSGWSVVVGGFGYDIFSGVIDTVGAGREAFGFFSRPLLAGETLILDFSTVDTSGVFFSSGFAGLALFDLSGDGLGGGTDSEVIFIGDLFGSSSSWAISPGSLSSPPTTESADGTFTYKFDTGEWTLDFAGGGSGAGIIGAGFDIDAIRISNGSGGDIAFDTISIAAIPEPSAFLFGGLVCSVQGVNFARKRQLAKKVA